MVVLLVLALLGVAWPAFARAEQQPTDVRPAAEGLSQGLDPGTTVDFDLTRGRFLQPLPFDVQFYIKGPVLDAVTRVTGRYARRSSRQLCETVLAPGSRTVNLGAARFIPVANARQVELSVPPLPPNRQYCFEFTLTLKADEARLRQIVAEQLDLQLQALYGNEASLSLETAFDQFRAGLLLGIRDAAAELERETGLDLRLTVPPDSFFAPPPGSPAAIVAGPDDPRPPITQRQGTPSSAIRLKERVEFAGLLQAQAAKQDAIDTFRRSAAVAVAELARLRAMPGFAMVIAQLRANLAQPLVSLRMPTDSALRFAAVQAEDDVAQATGIAPNQISLAVNVDGIWDPAQLGERVTNLDATIAQLQAFRQIVLDLAALDPLRDAAGLGPTVNGAANPNAVTVAELSAIAQQVDRVRQRLAEARSALTTVQEALKTRTATIEAAANRITADLIEVIEFDGTTTATWDTRTRSYVSADVGVAWSDPIQSFFFYVGANFYLGPVNKRAPLRWSEPGNLRKRFAFMAGVPMNPFEQEPEQLQAGDVQLNGVIGNRPLLLGAGLRLNDLVRVTGGTVFFRVRSPNPLITTTPVDYSWFLAFSIDWDLKGMFTNLRPASTRSSPLLRR